MNQERARELLKPMKITYVAEQIGISSMTIYRFSKGDQIMPNNYEKLVNWLEEYMKGEK